MAICLLTSSTNCKLLSLNNFSVTEDIFIYPVGYDPWGRDTPFYTDEGLESWRMYRSWGKGWREIKLDQTCTGTWCGAPDNKGVAYSFVFREGRDYQVKIEAIKKYPNEDVKWGFGPVDPVWIGTNWTMEGDKVYFEDSKVYISAEPHTPTESGWVYFNITSKVYSGNVDLALGFETDKLKPKKAELFSPHNVSYVYEVCNNQTGCEEVLESHIEDYKDIPGNFDSMDYDYGGMKK